MNVCITRKRTIDESACKGKLIQSSCCEIIKVCARCHAFNFSKSVTYGLCVCRRKRGGKRCVNHISSIRVYVIFQPICNLRGCRCFCVRWQLIRNHRVNDTVLNKPVNRFLAGKAQILGNIELTDKETIHNMEYTIEPLEFSQLRFRVIGKGSECILDDVSARSAD